MTSQGTIEENLIIYNETTFDELVVEYKDFQGAPINITAYTALMSIKNINGVEVLSIDSTATTGSRLIKTNATGLVQIVLATSAFPPLEVTTYNYDLILYNATETRRLAKGILAVLPVTTVAP